MKKLFKEIMLENKGIEMYEVKWLYCKKVVDKKRFE
jgi:hypothetical protein